MPPFSYDSAVRWSDETVTSDIPRADRVYILGPEKVTETYTLDGLPSRHDVEVRRAIPFKHGLTLAEVFRHLRLDASRHLAVSVYRARAKSVSTPVFYGEAGQKSITTFVMEPRDVVWLFYFDPNAKPTPVT